ncbi:luciferase family oxidoreductase [Mycoplasmopsis californica]|uniref:Luciferase family oxidoreductase n=1 Tax=Mycoplasmopsis californica TaxID=2113 RepID=A0A059XRG4_9BACT|nr:LLM class flavin-dependent oxidoreductase [Mycoplasmopsis californica]AIA29378.1 luciferase family oxidoreductase [Mycoplasmopsis californica]
MKISVLEHGLLTTKNGYKKTYQDLEKICRYSEYLGFYSFWVSEQHDVNALVITNPLILLSHLTSKTKKIKIGCGGIMLKHYQPFSIAEQINTLNLLYPKRLIFGFGANSSTEKVSKLMNTDISSQSFYLKMEQTVDFINRASDFDFKVNPSIDEPIEPTLLITSEKSAIFAAEHKYKINYGWFLYPSKIYAKAVIDTYKKIYKQKWGVDPSDIALSVNVVSGADDIAIENNKKVLALFRIGSHQWNEFKLFPTIQDFSEFNFDEEKERIFNKFYRNIFALKSTEDVKNIDNLCVELGIDHLMVLPTMSSVKDRMMALKKIANYYKIGERNEKDY